MKTQLTRFLAVSLAFVLTQAKTADGGLSGQQIVGASVPSAREAGQDWLGFLSSCMDLIYHLIGGDPEQIDQEASIEAKFGIVAGHYTVSGIPDSISILDRLLLIESIDSLYDSLQNPPAGAPDVRSENFLKILRLMWEDLGLPIEDLAD